MDPNANIEEQRRIAAEIQRLEDIEETRENAQSIRKKLAEKALRLAELVRALDGWLCSGGALPCTWERK